MSVSDIISIISAVISLIVAIVIAVVQYKQGKRMEELSLKQDKKQKIVTAQRIKAECNSFIMKYKNDYDEIYMLPLCWIASIYDPAHAYHRKMYMEYNMLEEDIQKAICDYMNFNVAKPETERDAFYADCVKSLKEAEFRNTVDNKHRSVYYDNAKYFQRTFEYYGGKELPIDLFSLESRLTDLLRDYKENPHECSNPIVEFLSEFHYYSQDEVEACEICTVLSKWLAEFEIDIDTINDDYWIPGGYGYEQIRTMEDLFLCALLCVYLFLIMPKKKGNEDE